MKKAANSNINDVWREFSGGEIKSLYFSPDGKTLAICGGADNNKESGFLKIFNCETCSCLQTFNGHKGSVDSVCFSPDGNYIASGCRIDGTVKIWKILTGDCVQTLKDVSSEGPFVPANKDYRYPNTSVCFSPDGKRLASGGADKNVKIWDWGNGQCLQTLSGFFSGHSKFLRSICFHPDGVRVASGSQDANIKIWDSKSGKCLHTLKGHSNYVTSVCFNFDGKRLASGSIDRLVKIWDSEKGINQATLYGHREAVYSVCFSPDSKRLVSGGKDWFVKIWDCTTNACIQTLAGHGYTVNSVIFSPDGKRLATGSAESIVGPGKKHPPGNEDKTVKIWEIRDEETVITIEKNMDWAMSVCFSPDGQRLAFKNQIWDVTKSKSVELKKFYEGVRSACFSPDGNFLATGGGEKIVKIWDTSTRKCLKSLEGHTHDVNSVCFSPDQKKIASGSRDKTIKIWDFSNEICLQTFTEHQESILSICYSPEGGKLASGSVDGTMRIWDCLTGNCLHIIKHSSWVYSVCFSPEGKQLASCSENFIKIWDSEKNDCIRTIEAKHFFKTICFSKDGKRLASGDSRGNVIAWDSVSGECVQKFGGHGDEVASVCFSPDGKMLASGGLDCVVNIWVCLAAKIVEEKITSAAKIVEENTKEKTVPIKPRKMALGKEDLPKEVEYASIPVLKKTNLLDESYIKAKYDENQLRSIGKGGFGEVFMGVRKDGTGTFAVKVIETYSQDDLNEALNELINLSNLRDHPNIISYESYRQNHVVMENNNSLYQIFIELPLASNTLSNVLKYKTRLEEEFVILFHKQITSGLKFAHDKKFVHLDLKPENILLMGDICKITDWGGSIRLRTTNSTSIKSKIQITEGYNAPEISIEAYGEVEKLNFYLCDIYSLGMLCFRMCGIEEKTIRSIPKGIKKYHDQCLEEIIFSALKNQYSEQYLLLLRRITAFESKERADLAEVLTLLDNL